MTFVNTDLVSRDSRSKITGRRVGDDLQVQFLWRKNAQVPSAKLDEWTTQVHKVALQKAADADVLDAAWTAVPKKLRSETALREQYFEGLMRVGLHDRAEKELTAALKSDWQGSLAH